MVDGPACEHGRNPGGPIHESLQVLCTVNFKKTDASITPAINGRREQR